MRYVSIAFAMLLMSQATAFAQEPSDSRRPAPLVPLYVSQIALHGLDVHSTLQALDRGHQEGNPLFRNATAGQMIGAKAASSAVSIWLAEKLWKKNRVAAVVVMTGVNVGLAAVVANNYRVASTSVRQ